MYTARSFLLGERQKYVYEYSFFDRGRAYESDHLHDAVAYFTRDKWSAIVLQWSLLQYSNRHRPLSPLWGSNAYRRLFRMEKRSLQDCEVVVSYSSVVCRVASSILTVRRIETKKDTWFQSCSILSKRCRTTERERRANKHETLIFSECARASTKTNTRARLVFKNETEYYKHHACRSGLVWVLRYNDRSCSWTA